MFDAIVPKEPEWEQVVGAAGRHLRRTGKPRKIASAVGKQRGLGGSDLNVYIDFPQT